MGRHATKPPTQTSTGTRYEDDLYTWVQEQVALLRAGRLSEVDAQNVAEELSDVGKSECDKLESLIAVLTQHLLIWDHQPKRRTRSWALTVREQRRRVDRVLHGNPGLKRVLPQAVKAGYADGRDRALSETGLPDTAIPEICPYTFEQIMKREILAS